MPEKVWLGLLFQAYFVEEIPPEPKVVVKLKEVPPLYQVLVNLPQLTSNTEVAKVYLEAVPDSAPSPPEL